MITESDIERWNMCHIIGTFFASSDIIDEVNGPDILKMRVKICEFIWKNRAVKEWSVTELEKAFFNPLNNKTWDLTQTQQASENSQPFLMAESLSATLTQ